MQEVKLFFLFFSVCCYFAKTGCFFLAILSDKERADALKEAVKALPEENRLMAEHLFEFLNHGKTKPRLATFSKF